MFQMSVNSPKNSLKFGLDTQNYIKIDKIIVSIVSDIYRLCFQIIQNKLRELRKNGKLDKDTYKKLYPSVALTPTANPVIKAHKPEKNYPVRLITSHIGAPQESLSTHLGELLQPLLLTITSGGMDHFESQSDPTLERVTLED